VLNLERLRALDAVAVHGSIARAAAALHVTASGLSQQLAKLERESGHGLLEPHGRSVRLTQAGRVLAEHAARVVAEAAAAESDLADLGDEVLGPLRLGGVNSPLRALLPDAMAALARDHPRLAPTLVDGEVVDLVPRLVRGDLDLLLVESYTNRPSALPAGLAVRRLVVEDVHVALPARHPLAARELVELAELDGEVWASCAAGTEQYEALVQAARSCGVEPDIRYTVSEIATHLALVACGLTVALLPEMGLPRAAPGSGSAHGPAPDGVRLLPVRPRLCREILAVWREAADGPSIRACVSALAQAAG